MYKAICPKNSEHTEFVTTAHVMQEWRVDAHGDFLDVTDDCLQVTHRPRPDLGNHWTCHECGTEAVFVRGFGAQPANQAKED